MSYYTVKPWGSERLFLKLPFFWIKYLYIKDGHRTSTQYHHHRSELHISRHGIRVYKPKDVHTCLAGRYVEFAWGRPDDKDIVRTDDPYRR